MNIYTDKKQENKRQWTANKISQKKNSAESAFQFLGNRLENIIQRQMYKLTENRKHDATQRKHEGGVVQRFGVYAPAVLRRQ